MTTTSNPKIEGIRQNVCDSYDRVNQLINDQLASLDPEQLYESPGGGEWSLMQSLAHIIEFLPYWADEIKKLVAHPRQKFGRTQEDEGRLRAIREHGSDALNQVRIALPNSYEYLEDVLKTLKDSDLELTGVHPKFGEQTLGWFIKDFITDHFANHIQQMKACLTALNSGSAL